MRILLIYTPHKEEKFRLAKILRYYDIWDPWAKEHFDYGFHFDKVWREIRHTKPK